jgi:hypothetical protein
MQTRRYGAARRVIGGVLLCVIAGLSSGQAAPGRLENAPDKPRAAMVRVENFTVTPSTGPVANVIVHNPTETAMSGTLRANFPKGWTVTPETHELKLSAGQTQSFPFATKRAADSKANVYPVEVRIESSANVVVRQEVVCASAPYYQPTIDGDANEWKDSIPITMTTAGRQTVVRLYWNRRDFCMMVEVEEDALVGYDPGRPKSPFDAIQFAIAKRSARTGESPTDKAQRYEYLVVHAGDDGRCFRLMTPGTELAAARQNRPLEPLRLAEAKVVVKRTGKITRYELAIPFTSMPDLRPTPGREFCFSLLVHDTGGTGLRDMGSVMNMWESNRPALAWCRVAGVKWPDKPPFDNKIEFGFCSSIH